MFAKYLRKHLKAICMRTLLTRTFYGLIFAIVMIGSILFHPLLFAAVLLIIVVTGSAEMLRLHKKYRFSANERSLFHLISMGSFILAAGVATGFYSFKYLAILLVFVMFPLVHALFSAKHNHVSISSVHWLNLFYISLPSAGMLFFFSKEIAGEMAGPMLLLTVIFFVWINDTFAYLVGMAIGKHRLFPRISPKKSWEGSIGGLISTLLASYLFSLTFDWLEAKDSFWIALIVVISGSLGDLIESMLKRDANVKDSGKIMPGHGGVLDRFDATFFAIPFVLIYLLIH